MQSLKYYREWFNWLISYDVIRYQPIKSLPIVTLFSLVFQEFAHFKCVWTHIIYAHMHLKFALPMYLLWNKLFWNAFGRDSNAYGPRSCTHNLEMRLKQTRPSSKTYYNYFMKEFFSEYTYFDSPHLKARI